MYKLSKRSLSRLKGVEPLLIAIAVESIKESPFDFGIPETGGFRTANQQNELFKKKVSKVDGFIKKSYHQSGLAFDIYLLSDTENINKLSAVARHIQKTAYDLYKVKVQWGGDWKWVDAYHFQIEKSDL